MKRRPGFSAVLLLIGLLLFQGLAPDLQAQGPPPPTPQQLDQLLAPVALYPDALLAQITTASTNPQEILDVDNWLAQNRNLTLSQLTAAAQQQGFDPAFVALVGFPQVIEMMAENIDDYAAIGAAVTANQGEVAASIQRLRAQAYASGALRSTPTAASRVAAGWRPAHLCDPAGESAGCVCAAIQPHGCLRRILPEPGADYLWHWHRDYSFAGEPALGLGRLGMELGRPPDLLQPGPVGRVGRGLSATAHLVSAAPGTV
jgi:hypothetical protein